MHVIDDVTACTQSFSNLVLTIGNFDGFHLGHQKMVQEVIRLARARNGAAALMSLWPHPRNFFNPHCETQLLSSRLEKRQLLEAAGLDVYFVLPFNEQIAHMDREAFLTEIVLGKCGAQSLVIGHDFSFGAGARGDFEYLTEVSDRFGLEVVQLPALKSGAMRVSSTLVREAVKAGDMATVQSLLGRPYTLSGPVITGRGMGRELGYPTANVAPPENLLPAFGIYGARVYWEGKDALGAVNIGVAPTLQHAGPMVEVHLLDVDEPLVGKNLTIALYHRLRGEVKFPDLASLKAAIEKDIVTIRGHFAT